MKKKNNNEVSVKLTLNVSLNEARVLIGSMMYHATDKEYWNEDTGETVTVSKDERIGKLLKLRDLVAQMAPAAVNDAMASVLSVMSDLAFRIERNIEQIKEEE